MLQTYKLRLGDGTVLGVDYEGLSTWLVDRKAMVQAAGSRQWRPLREFLAEERVAARRASRQKSYTRKELPLVYPKPHEDPPPRPPAAPPTSDPGEPLSIGEPADVQVVAEEPAVPSQESTSHQSTPEEDIPLIPLDPLEGEPSERLAASLWRDTPEPARSARPSLQVLADDPVARHAGRTRQTSTPDDGLPIIPLKPLEDLDEALPSKATEPGTDEEEGGAVVEETPWRGRLEETLLRLMSAYDALLTGWIDRLARRASGGYTPRRSADDAAPKGSKLHRRASAWVDGLTGWVSRFTRQDRPFPLVPPKETAAARAADPISSEPLKAPPSISELPLLRFADPPEPEDAGDVYAGEGEGLLPVAWRWTKRIVLMSGLVAGGLLAALTWDTWSPKASLFGRMVVAEIDKRVESRDQIERQRRALQEATAQLPHLTPDTIRLVLSRSPEGVLDPPEVFSLACDAADRGLSALTSGEAGELKALRHELLDKLRPSERQRVREYDSTRTRRVAFPFENRDVLDLFASGARVLPSRSRQRLQELLGKAIAAGLVLPTEGAPRPAAER